MQSSTILILVKHAMPVVDPDAPAREWVLSDAGRRASELLAERLANFSPAVILTSDEPKAQETAAVVAARLGKPLEIRHGLHEHDRAGVPYLGRREFERSVLALFRSPSELVFGNETAEEALARFEASLSKAIAEHSGRTIVAVAHGTVISLFAAKATGADAFSLWKRLGLPSFAVFSLPELGLLDIVERIDQSE